VTWKTVAANSGVMHPSNLTQWNSNLFLLLTKRGGHVGWPTGWMPHLDKWKWMSDISVSFVKAFSDSQASMERDGPR
jgi:predicted alpha/beta-fold hydrolase